MSSSAALSGAAKRKKRKLQAQRNEAEQKKIPKISNFLLCVRPAPDHDSTNDLDLLLDDEQGKLT
jgi:hypothetical protein